MSKKTQSKKRAGNICYRRILEIDKMISIGGYPSSKILAEKAGASIPTIKRDIEHMRIFLNAPIAYNKFHEGWYYESAVFRLPALFINEKQQLAAALTKQLVESLHGTSAYDGAKELLTELTSSVDNPGTVKAHALQL